MCFSAPVSFISAAAIGTVGVATLKKTEKRSERLLASIPFLLAVLQLAEGVVWLTHDTSPQISMVAAYVFNLISNVGWPTILPLSVFLIEKDGWRKKVLSVLVAFGALTSLWILISMIRNGVVLTIVQDSIRYFIEVPYITVIRAVYVAAASSFLLSRERMVQFFGLCVLVSFFLTFTVYKQTYVSVWCLFAAYLSVILYAYFAGKAKR